MTGAGVGAAGTGGTAGTCTVLFTDLVSSTELRTRLGEEAADDLRRRHDEAVRAAVTSRAGTVVKGLGDGVMATFASAADGVAAAVAAQETIVRLNRRLEGTALEIRVGISAGDVTWEDGDVFGEPVIEASRLCSAAAGGEILCSDVVRLLARGRGGHRFDAAGELDLKGLPEPVAAHRVAWSAPTFDLPLPPALRTRSPFPYVGRAAEREALTAAWKRAAAGEPGAVLIAGEPGVGKTRMVSTVAAAAHDDGAVVLAGSCDEQVSAPFQPVVEALRHFLAHCPAEEVRSRLGVHGAELARLVPEVAALLGEAGEASVFAGDEDAERLGVFDAVGGWLGAAGAGEPVLLVLDDLHWADTGTVLLLRHLMRGIRVPRLLIAGTYRDTDLDRTHPLSAALADLRREPGVERVRLRGLTTEEVAALVAAAAGHELDAAGNALARTLHAETEGNPFFLEEVILHLIETGAIYQADDGRWTSDVSSVDELGIPEGVREVVGRRLSRLSDACNRTLGLAAVLGPSFDVAVLRAVAGDASELGVVEALEEAERAGLLAEASESAGSYGFTHALVRQTLLDELSLARRQQYHVRAADALESGGRASAAAVAFHLRAAGAAADAERAVTASLIAADEARRQLAWEEASDHWEAALELLELSGDEPGRTARLLELLGDAMYATARDWQRGLDQLERAASLYDQIGDPTAAAKVRVKIGRNLSTFNDRVDIHRAFANYEAAELVLRERPESASYGYLLVGLSTGETYRADHEAGEQAALQALDIALANGNQNLRTNAELLLGWHQGFLGDPDGGLATIAQAYLRAIEIGNPVLSFLGAWMTTGLAVNVFDYKTALRALHAEVDSGRLDGAPGFRAAVIQNQAHCLIHTGRLDEARALMDVISLSSMGERLLQWMEGDWETAAEAWGEIAVDAFAVGNVWNGHFYVLQRAQCLALTGDVGAGVALYRSTVEPAPDGSVEQLWGRALLGTALAEVGQLEEARENAYPCRQALERGGLRGLEGLLQITVALAAGDQGEAASRLRAAIDNASSYGNPWIEAEALLHLAQVTGQPAHADAAVAIYEGTGMGRPWVDRALRIRSSI